jgi:hypothetical protein
LGPKLDLTKQEARRAGVWISKEARRDVKDFFRFWAVELIVIAVLNVHVGKIVDHVAGMFHH